MSLEEEHHLIAKLVAKLGAAGAVWGWESDQKNLINAQTVEVAIRSWTRTS
jgi:hypothetical protein